VGFRSSRFLAVVSFALLLLVGAGAFYEFSAGSLELPALKLPAPGPAPGPESYPNLVSEIDPNVQFLECNVDVNDGVKTWWCIYLYRNMSIAVTRDGRVVHVVDRDTMLKLMFRPEWEFNVTLGQGPHNSTTMLNCIKTLSKVGCSVVHWKFSESGRAVAKRVVDLYLYPYSLLWDFAEEIDFSKFLTTLDGRLYTLDGDKLTERLWSRMTEYRASDERVWSYIEWLRRTVSTEEAVPGYSRVFHWWRASPPDNNSLVRIGRIELPFGVGLIVTAYTASGGVMIVVHGTIVDMTEWLKLLARLNPSISWSDVINITQEWVLWRMVAEPLYPFILQENVTAPVRSVVLLLEMPIYTLYSHTKPETYWWLVEYMYWTLVHPAFALAVRLFGQPNDNIWTLYTNLGIAFAREIVGPGCGWTPYLTMVIEWSCPEYIQHFEVVNGVISLTSNSNAKILLLSNFLGMHAAHITAMAHVMTALVNATIYRDRAIDVDRDGRLDSTIISDIPYYLTIDQIRRNIDYIHTSPPFLATLFSDIEIYPISAYHHYIRFMYYVSGVINATLNLPTWLRAPWTDALIESTRFHQLLGESVAEEAKKGTLMRVILEWQNWYSKYATMYEWTPPPSHWSIATITPHTPLLHKAVTPPPNLPGTTN